MTSYADSETSLLRSGSDAGGQRDKQTERQAERQTPDWDRYGLGEGQGQTNRASRTDDDDEATFTHSHPTDANEIYSEDLSSRSTPWWKSNFFVSEPILFGTWDGVFTSCMINIFGVIIFLRTGWMVGNVGIGLAVLIIFLTALLALVPVLSAIGVCERCHMERGGVYFLLSHVLGKRLGASIGVLYCFGQAVSVSLYVLGFGESIMSLFHQDNVWIARGIAIAVLLMLLGINIAGVQWVIRLQLILLLVLFVAVLDFMVGSFVHTNPANGFVGYNVETWKNNTSPSYTPGQSFFSVFGVYFPTATGVFAGINMSGDLINPSKNIPRGTLSAIGVSTLLYLIFALILGATCVRHNLQTDYMIAERVSIVGVLFLAGLYISSISSGMGGLYGSPRIVQCIASDGVIPIIEVLSKGRGPNKVPVYSLTVIVLVALIFIFIGKVNTLGPVVTMPFLLTYAAVDYAYFVLSMSYDKKDFSGTPVLQQGYAATYYDEDEKLIQSGEEVRGCDGGYGTLDRQITESPSRAANPGAINGGRSMSEESDSNKAGNDSSNLVKSGTMGSPSKEISRQPRSFYSIFCNRWISLIGAITSVVIMFTIQWGYALANIALVVLVFIYIGIASPSVSPGIAEFSILRLINNGFKRIFRKNSGPAEQRVVTSGAPAMSTTSAQLNEDNEDFAGRGRFHQSAVVEGKNFDDFSED